MHACLSESEMIRRRPFLLAPPIQEGSGTKLTVDSFRTGSSLASQDSRVIDQSDCSAPNALARGPHAAVACLSLGIHGEVCWRMNFSVFYYVMCISFPCHRHYAIEKALQKT